MEVEVIAQKLLLKHRSNYVKIVDKSRELIRMSAYKMPVLGQGEICRNVVCVELACEVLKEEFNQRNAIQISAAPRKIYIQTLDLLRGSLGIRSKITFKELGVQFGCIFLISTCEKILQHLKTSLELALNPIQRSYIDFDKPAFVAAVFYSCCKRAQVRVDRNLLIDISKTNLGDFQSVQKLIFDHCEEMFTKLETEMKSSRKTEEQKEKEDQEQVIIQDKLIELRLTDGICAMLPSAVATTSTKTKKVMDYEKWKNDILQRLEQQSAEQEQEQKGKIKEIQEKEERNEDKEKSNQENKKNKEKEEEKEEEKDQENLKESIGQELKERRTQVNKSKKTRKER